MSDLLAIDWERLSHEDRFLVARALHFVWECCPHGRWHLRAMTRSERAECVEA